VLLNTSLAFYKTKSWDSTALIHKVCMLFPMSFLPCLDKAVCLGRFSRVWRNVNIQIYI